MKDGQRGRAGAPVLSRDDSFRLNQKTANFKVASFSRPMQWSALTEEKQKNELAQTEFRFIKTIKMRGRHIPNVLRLYISVALQQKTANFNVATASRQMQWSALTEEKQTNQLALTEFHFTKTIITIRGG